MKNTIQLQDFGFLIMRSTLFPAYESDGSNKRLFLDKTSRPEDILKKMDNGLFAEALLLSSRSLYKEYQSLRLTTTPNAGATKVFKKLLQYYLRLHTRTTPFGISAGSALLQIGEQTNIRMTSPEQNKKTVRLNFDFYQTFLRRLLSADEQLPRLSYFSNNTFTTDHKGHSFLRCNQYPYTRSRINRSRLIEEIVNFSRRTRTYPAILDFITTLTGDSEAASTLITRLIRIELLLPDIYPDILTNDTDRSLFQKLPHGPEKESLKNILDSIAVYEHTSPGKGIAPWFAANELIEKDLQTPKLDSFYVNYRLDPTASIISRQLIEELTHGLKMIFRLQHPLKNQRLDKFIAIFKERYGADVQIPLHQALDERQGIGYPVTQQMRITDTMGIDSLSAALMPGYIITEWDKFILTLFGNSLTDEKQKIITLTEKELLNYKPTSSIPAPSPSLFCTFNILSPSAQHIDKGNFRILFKGAEMGSAATKKINRVPDPDGKLEKCLRHCISEEQEFYRKKDIYLAELNYLPRAGNGGNILIRKNFLDHEIPLLTAPSHDKKNIDPTQLDIILKNGTLQLIDKTTGNRILPRATTVYDHTTSWSMSYNSFLTELQYQDSVGIRWDWGILNRILLHFPRVMLGNCILSEEAWIIRKTQFSGQAARQFGDWETAFRKMVKERSVYRYVYYRDQGDTELLLDLDNTLCLQLLFDFFSKTESLYLSEAFIDQDTCFLDDGTSQYCAEFILPLKIQHETSPPANTSAPQNTLTDISFLSNPYLAEEIILKLYKEGVKNDQAPPTALFRTRNAMGSSRVRLLLETNSPHIKQILDTYSNEKLIWDLQIGDIPHNTSPLEQAGTVFALETLSFLDQKKLGGTYDLRFLIASILVYNYMKAITASQKSFNSLAEHIVKDYQEEYPDFIANEKLADSYRTLLKMIQTDYAPLMSEIMTLIRVPMRSLAPVFSGMATENIAAGSRMIRRLVQLLGTSLMTDDFTVNDLSVLFDFVRKYQQQEKQLLQYRNINLTV